MQLLEVSNHLLGNRSALESQFEKNGYWFFKNVLDIEPLQHLRQQYIDVLQSHNLIIKGDSELTYTGASFDSFPGRFKLPDMEAWKAFVHHPGIQGFIEELFGEAIEWIPIIEYRAVRPLGKTPADRFQFWHCDGHFNPGIPYRTAWFPLCDMDDSIGGLAVRPGLSRGPKLENESRAPELAPEQITFISHDHKALAEDEVANHHYEVGDLLIFDKRTPHSGMHNLSNRFRLSMDIRFMLASDESPLVGELFEIGEGTIRLKSHTDQHLYMLEFDCNAMIRENITRFPINDFTQSFPVGTEVIVARQDGKATLMTHLYPPEKTYDDRGPRK